MKKLLLALVPFTFALPAHAYFSSPSAFQAAFNRVNWGNGTYTTLSHASQCQSFVWDDIDLERVVMIPGKGYKCYSGWITVKDPQGTRVCKLKYASYSEKRNWWSYDTHNCRWK